MGRRAQRRERRARLAAGEEEVRALQEKLECAYSVFNNTADPELLEAAILEIRALQSRYGCSLRALKALHSAGTEQPAARFQRSLGRASALS